MSLGINIVWPTENELEVVNAIRGAIGRNVTFVTREETPCPVCSLDPITNTSTDSFCLTCSGEYWIPVYSGITLSGHITWGHLDKTEWVAGGQYFEGDCRVQIAYTPSGVFAAENAEWIEVDEKQLEIKKKIFRGVQTLNRILLDCVERDNNV